MDLVVNLAEDEIRYYDPATPASPRAYGGALVSGISTRSFLIEAPRVWAVGVHFRPGGAFPFLGISPLEIVDAHADLGDLWGPDGQRLRERLLGASAPSEQLRILEGALLQRLRRAKPGHPAVRTAVAALHAGGSGLRVTQLVRQVGLSHRRLIELFEREVGLTPKLYARLQRFHCVKQRIATLDGPSSWAKLSLECGYFDQSHMIRDFVAFASVSPEHYLRGRVDETRFDQMVHAYPRTPGAPSAPGCFRSPVRSG